MPVVINNIKDGVIYTFMVSASNIFGTSEFVNVTWVSKGEVVCMFLICYLNDDIM